MTAAQHPERDISFDEYVRLAEASDDKLDYVDGRIVNVSKLIAMSGGSGEHSLITANFIREAGNTLKGKPCRAYDSNLRVGTGRHAYTHYPDVTIVCGERIYDPRDKSRQTVINPVAVVEVLSPSTFKYDFGEKFRRYREIDTLREYVMVSQNEIEVTTFFRHDDGTWRVRFFNSLTDHVPLQSVGIELALSEIYDGVTFPPPANELLP